MAATITRSKSKRVRTRNPDGLGDVEDERNDGADRELPLEAEPDIDKDHPQADDQGQDAVAEELGGDRGADGVGAEHLAARFGLVQGGLDLVDHGVGRGSGRLGAEADQHLIRGAEALHALLGDVLAGQGVADLAEIGGALGADLHDDAA